MAEAQSWLVEAPQRAAVQVVEALTVPPKVPVQSDGAITTQALVPRQHAEGCGQVLGEQTPARVQTLGLAHPALVVTVQVPAVAQQEPVGGQGLGEHSEPSPW